MRVRVGSAIFNVNDDTEKIYRAVEKIIGGNEKARLAIVLALYKSKKRKKYGEMVEATLINPATRQVALAVSEFFLNYHPVDPKNSKRIASKVMKSVVNNIYPTLKPSGRK